MIYLCQGQGHLPISKYHWRRHCHPLSLFTPLPHLPSSPAPPPPALLKLGSPTFVVRAGESSMGLAPPREEGRCPRRILPSSFPNYQGNPTLSALYCHITLPHKEWNKEIEREVEYEWGGSGGRSLVKDKVWYQIPEIPKFSTFFFSHLQDSYISWT